jgi:rod shape-determining protein MreD
VRRHIIAGLTLFVLAVIETSLLPEVFGALPRPNLVLIVTSTWAAIRGDEGFVWAAAGGLMLDVLSGAPFGGNLAGLVLGNTAALLLDRAPIPVAVLRVTTWVAVTTVVYYAVALVVLAFTGQPYNIQAGFAGVVLPSLIINPVLAIPTYALLNQLQARLRDQERFLPER